MGGLAIGSILGWKQNRKTSRTYLVINQLFVGLTTALFVVVISKANIVWGNMILYTLFLGATLIPSILAGFQFSQMIKYAPNHERPGRLYAAYLFGAALGAALVPVMFLPVWGINVSVLIIFGFSAISAVFLLTSKE
ncbi:MAG: hypothetical protein Q8928_04895 [Bacteroidota bacterium]|nr:hypothetical protein [Bacteroidota bacterium]